jgi:hypothetical protein
MDDFANMLLSKKQTTYQGANMIRATPQQVDAPNIICFNPRESVLVTPSQYESPA